MRTSLIIALLTLVTLNGFSQQIMFAENTNNTEEVIYTGLSSEVQNTAGANAFLESIYEQTQTLIAFRDSVTTLKREIEANPNWQTDTQMQVQQLEYEEALSVCMQMLSTNERILSGQIALRSVDPILQ